MIDKSIFLIIIYRSTAWVCKGQYYAQLGVASFLEWSQVAYNLGNIDLGCNSPYHFDFVDKSGNYFPIWYMAYNYYHNYSGLSIHILGQELIENDLNFKRGCLTFDTPAFL